MRKRSPRAIAVIGIFAAVALVMIGLATKGWMATIGWVGAFIVLVVTVILLSYCDKLLRKR